MPRDTFPSDPTAVVCIPTYNNEESVRTTLEHVLAQSRLPDRIVVCDKSDDDTPAIVSDVAADAAVPIDLIRQTGDGVAAAYDQMLDYVEGDYDLFLTFQSNLRVEDDWLENHVRIHREHPEIDLVTGDRLSNEDGEGVASRRPTEREVSADESTYYVGRNFSAKAGTLERIDGWDRNFLRGEDWDMRIRLAGAGTRVYATRTACWEWQDGADDPTITLSKTKRRPTSVSFLAKYGLWYAKFHPSHVIGDTLSVLAVAFAGLAVLTLPLSFVLSLLSLLCLVAVVVPYVAGLAVLRGGVDGDLVVAPLVKQFLVGIGVFYAIRRVLTKDTDWNKTGFDPENVPRYRY